MKEIVQGMTQGGDKEGRTYLGTVVGPLSFMKVSKKKKKKRGNEGDTENCTRSLGDHCDLDYISC